VLTKLGRNILTRLPVWAEEEDAHVEAEGGPENSVRSYTLSEFYAERVADAQTLPPMTPQQTEVALDALVDAGYASKDDEGRYRMTEAGFEAIHEPEPDSGLTAEGEPGAVFLDLKPATLNSGAKG